MVPGPPARIEIERAAATTGGRAARALECDARTRGSATGATDRVVWRSSAPAVVRVDDERHADRRRARARDGHRDARAPRPQLVHGQRRRRTRSAAITVTPATANARTGDVDPLQQSTCATARARRSAGSRRRGAFTPGNGMIEQDGAFVGYEPRHVHGRREPRRPQRECRPSSSMPRDVRRPAEVRGPPAAHGCSPPRKCGCIPNGRTPVPRHRRAAAIACTRSTSAIRRSRSSPTRWSRTRGASTTS